MWPSLRESLSSESSDDVASVRILLSPGAFACLVARRRPFSSGYMYRNVLKYAPEYELRRSVVLCVVVRTRRPFLPVMSGPPVRS